MLKSIFLLISSISILVACRTQTGASSLQSELGDRVARADEKFGDEFQKSDTLAICVEWQGSEPMSALTLRFSGSFDGPSFHHEPHVRGSLARVLPANESSEGVTQIELRNGELVRVSGEEGPKESVSTIKIISLLDDSAAREYRDQVEIVTNFGVKKWSNCRFGKAIVAIRSDNSGSIGERIKNADQKYLKEFEKNDTLAICVLWQGSEPMNGLTLRFSGTFTGPSMHHEPHVRGSLSRVLPRNQSPEGVTIVQLKNGVLVQVAGEDGPQETVSAIKIISVLDDSAAREYRNEVELITNMGTKKWSNCRFGKAAGAIRPL